ncbi:MAG: hypothetical protein MZV63_13750 [Marinilabiliales bacterium]|nr:hypothetical protein [Marinilabiliales bacterium]
MKLQGLLSHSIKPASSGSYLAYFDDILISAANNSPTAIDKVPVREKMQCVFTRDQTLVFNADALNSNVKIYDISGKLLSDFILEALKYR